MKLSYRTAVEADVPDVVALVETAYRGEASREGWTTEADILDGQRTDTDAIEDILADPGSRLMLAFDGDNLVACCHLERREGYAYFGMFAVKPTLQGSGVGKQVLAAAERWVLHEWDIHEMHMTVISVREELITWYERRGYARTGKRTPFPYGDDRFGLPRRDDLEFELLVKELT